MEIHIANAIRKGEVRAVGDGLFKDKWGTSDLILEGSRYNHQRISATSTVTGNPNNHNAYRSELTCILHGVLIVQNITTKYHITEGEITASCNRLNRIRMSLDQHST